MTSEHINLATPTDQAAPGLHVLGKRIGPGCSVKCDHYFYLEKDALFGTGRATARLEQHELPLVWVGRTQFSACVFGRTRAKEEESRC